MSITPIVNKITNLHIPCEACGSSDARCEYEDGHSYCFSCQDYKPGNNSLSDVFTYEYLPWRGIDASTFRTYGAKTKIAPDGQPLEIGYPERNGSYHIRRLQEKSFYHKGEYKAGCFGVDKFMAGSHRYITIKEGYEDALSLQMVLRSPVVSVHSASAAVADCSADRSYLNSFERIYLAFDGDESGRDAAASVAKLFDYSKLYEVKFPGGNRKVKQDF